MGARHMEAEHQTELSNEAATRDFCGLLRRPVVSHDSGLTSGAVHDSSV